MSWRREDGEVILMGGSDSGSEKTTEVVSSSGAQKVFDLRYKTK